MHSSVYRSPPNAAAAAAELGNPIVCLGMTQPLVLQLLSIFNMRSM
jgi:hypothetical protein